MSEPGSRQPAAAVQRLDGLIRAHMQQHGWSYSDLERTSSRALTRGRWQQLGSGAAQRRFPDPDTLAAIAQVLGLDITTVVLAAAQSVGLEVASTRAEASLPLPAGTERLSVPMRHAFLTMLRTAVAETVEGEVHRPRPTGPRISEPDGPPRETTLAETFARLTDNLVTEYDVIDVLEELSRECATLFTVDSAGLLVDDPGGRLRMIACSSEQAQLVELFALQDDEGPCRDCVATGEPVTVRDLADDEAGTRWPQFAPHALAVGFHAVHALPMRLHNRTIGALNLFTVEPGNLLAADLRAAQALADVAAISIVSGRDRRTPQGVRDQLRMALDSRVVVEQARGVLAERGGLDGTHAFRLLRDHARRNGLPLTEVARGIVAGQLDPLPLLAVGQAP